MVEVVYDYIDQVNPNLVCAICHNPFIDPVTTSSCKHTFCRSCILQSLAHRSLCPIDRSQIDQSTLQYAGPVVRNILEELEVRCLSDGCDYKGQRGLMVGHTNLCAKRTITCQNEGCGQEIMREELADHRAYKCKARRLRCRTCNDLIAYHSFSTHVHSISPGPACGCISNHPQETHRWSCPEAEIPCDNADLGCPKMIKRSNLSDHLTTCVIEKIAPTLRAQMTMMADMQERIDRLEKQNRRYAQHAQRPTTRTSIASGRPSSDRQDSIDMERRIRALLLHVEMEGNRTPLDLADELRDNRQRLERLFDPREAEEISRRTGEYIINGVTNRQRLERRSDLRNVNDISRRTGGDISGMTVNDSAMDIHRSDTLDLPTADTREGAESSQAGPAEVARMSIDTVSPSLPNPPGETVQDQIAPRPAAPTWEHYGEMLALVRDLTDQTWRLERTQQAQALSGDLRLQEEVAELRGMVNVMRPHVLGGGQNISLPPTSRVPSFDGHSNTPPLSESITEEAEGDDETPSLRESIAFSSQHADPDHDSETSSIQSMVTANRSINRRNRWGGGLGQPMGIPPELGEGTATVRVTVQRPSEEVGRGERVLRPRNSVLNRFISRTPRNARGSGSQS